MRPVTPGSRVLLCEARRCFLKAAVLGAGSAVSRPAPLALTWLWSSLRVVVVTAPVPHHPGLSLEWHLPSSRAPSWGSMSSLMLTGTSLPQGPLRIPCLSSLHVRCSLALCLQDPHSFITLDHLLQLYSGICTASLPQQPSCPLNTVELDAVRTLARITSGPD